MLLKRPRDLPYNGDLTWDNNGWIIAAEAAQMEDNNVLLTHYMQAYNDITDRDGTEDDRPLVQQTPKQEELLPVIQEMCGVALELNSYHSTIKASEDLMETLNEIISVKAGPRASPNDETTAMPRGSTIDRNRLYELFTHAAELLAPFTQEYRAWLLPKIAPPAEHLMMSSPFFHDAFEKHVAWHKHLDELLPDNMATDRELWSIQEEIKKSYAAADARAALIAAIRRARDERIPLGEGYITGERARRVRLMREHSWRLDTRGLEPYREHGPTAVFRARLHFKASLGHEDEVQKLLKDAHGVIILGLKRIPTETIQQAEKRICYEKNHFKYLSRSIRRNSQ